MVKATRLIAIVVTQETPPTMLTASGATTKGISRTTVAFASHGRSRNTATKVSRYSANGTTHRNGAAAISVVKCAVTAITRPEGIAASAIHRIRIPALGAWSSSMLVFAATAAVDRAVSSPTPA